jgi:wobble nucleotide-excising tRNase
MSSTTSTQIDQLIEKTEASLSKFKDRADQLRSEMGDAKASTKVQIKAMVERLEAKYRQSEQKLEGLKKSGGSREDIEALHGKIVDDLQSMLRTINRRIH